MIRNNQELVDFVSGIRLRENDGFISEEAFGQKELVIAQGARSPFIYIIKSGIAKCFLSHENGTDFVQEFFGAGEIFGEVEMFDDEEYFCSVETITDFAVYKISRKNFFSLLERDPKFNSLILKALIRKIKYKAVRHAFHQSNSIETNLLRLVEQFPGVFDVIPKPDIANYLGITERSLNRSLKSLRERGLLFFQKS